MRGFGASARTSNTFWPPTERPTSAARGTVASRSTMQGWCRRRRGRAREPRTSHSRHRSPRSLAPHAPDPSLTARSPSKDTGSSVKLVCVKDLVPSGVHKIWHNIAERPKRRKASRFRRRGAPRFAPIGERGSLMGFRRPGAGERRSARATVDIDTVLAGGKSTAPAGSPAAATGASRVVPAGRGTSEDC